MHMNIRFRLFSLSLLFFSVGGAAQFDTRSNSGSFGPSGNSNTSGTFSLNHFGPKPQSEEASRVILLPENNTVDMTHDNGLVKPKVEIKPKWLETPAEAKHGSATTQFLGDFISETNSIRVMCRDHQAIDGDRVKILVNGEIFVDNIYLESNFKSFLLTLQPGFNTIDFVALNEGDSGPNTAEFKVVDDNGNTITHNYWNLNTGVKASIIIFKE